MTCGVISLYVHSCVGIGSVYMPFNSTNHVSNTDVSSETLSGVQNALERAGFDCWETLIGTQGVSLHW